eukprot:356550-Chlamydomonas_euryale.AAC.4
MDPGASYVQSMRHAQRQARPGYTYLYPEIVTQLLSDVHSGFLSAASSIVDVFNVLEHDRFWYIPGLKGNIGNAAHTIAATNGHMLVHNFTEEEQTSGEIMQNAMCPSELSALDKF